MSADGAVASRARPARSLAGIALGGDYNPEQWPEEVWAQDVALMREAGVTFATVGVFSWAWLEPEPGRFTFGWLDRVLDLLHEGGIAVDLATATASPPPWLSRANPETLPVDRHGHRLWPGSRQAWCPSSPVFRERALTLVEQLAGRYRDHPALAMWHVSNELGCHNLHCYCDVSAAAFRRWLVDRYGDLDRLNDAWGTAFWSQRYGDWAEILPPRLTTTYANPTQQLDFARFSSDELLDYFRAERDVLHQLSPGVPVTTNLMAGMTGGMDYFAWGREQDVVSQDHYLVARLPDPAAALAFSADLTRGISGGRPWFLMEHSTSAVNWQPVNPAKAPGQLVRNSLTHVARGADAVGFFQWRASRSGGEKYHSGLVPHAGTDTKVWRDVVRLGDVLGRIGEVAQTEVEAEIAVLYDYQAGWACDLDSHPSVLVRYEDVPRAVHRALTRLGHTVDLRPPGADLSRYRLVVVPTLYLVDDDAAAALHRYVEAGGHLVVTYFSGIVDPDDRVRLGGYPGAFRDLLGIRTEEFFPLAEGESVRLEVRLPGSAPATWAAAVWSELTHPVDAEVLAVHADGPVAGGPALTRREVGSGVAWYVGTRLDDDGWSHLLATAAAAAGATVTAQVPPGVEAVRRRGPDSGYLFLVNHLDLEVTVPAKGLELVGGNRAEGYVQVPAGGVAIVREDG